MLTPLGVGGAVGMTIIGTSCSSRTIAISSQPSRFAQRTQSLHTFSGRESRNQKRASLLHQACTLFVEKRSVFDRRDSCAHSKLDAFGSMRMRRNLSLKFVRFVDQRLQFFKGVLRYSDRIPFR